MKHELNAEQLQTTAFRMMSSKSKTLVIISSMSLLAIAVLALIAFKRAYSVSNRIPVCHENLVLIDLTKRNWASEYNKGTNDTPTWDDLTIGFPDWLKQGKYWTNGKPICPDGGIYLIGKVGELPKCSIGGGYNHELFQ